MKHTTVSHVLKMLEPEALSKARARLKPDGMFKVNLKTSFVKAFEFAVHTNEIKAKEATESSYFMSSALRSICEDLIVLTFLAKLKRKDRNDVIAIRLFHSINQASWEQRRFFKKYRPFQPVLGFKADVAKLNDERDRLTAIGLSSGLWNTERKLPPVQQMAIKVNLREVYDFIYSITSETVHFSPRIALRHGWGNDPYDVTMSMKNFCRYYLFFSQVYSVFMFALFCQKFRRQLGLTTAFMASVKELRRVLDGQIRWPEAVTYEEMNQEEPNIILRSALQIAHEEKLAKRRKKRAAAKSPKI